MVTRKGKCHMSLYHLFSLHVYRQNIVSEQKPTAGFEVFTTSDSKDKPLPRIPAHSAGRSSTHEIYRPSVNQIPRCLESQDDGVCWHSGKGNVTCLITLYQIRVLIMCKYSTSLCNHWQTPSYCSMIAGLKVELSCFIMFSRFLYLSCPNFHEHG